jgi:hypothetical protein
MLHAGFSLNVGLKLKPVWLFHILEPISKIADHVQEQGVSRRKSAVRHTFWRMSILRRITTQLLGVRCIFEIDSNHVCIETP